MIRNRFSLIACAAFAGFLFVLAFFRRQENLQDWHSARNGIPDRSNAHSSAPATLPTDNNRDAKTSKKTTGQGEENIKLDFLRVLESHRKAKESERKKRSDCGSSPLSKYS